MEFKEIVKNRYACRAYLRKRVPEETIRELVEIMRYSCSAINLQPWRIRIVHDQETKDKLFDATWGEIQVRTCSHLLVLCADTDYPAIIAKLDETLAEAGTDTTIRVHLVHAASDIARKMTHEQRLQWSQNQVHIMLGNAVNGAFSLGLASCPMTAFNPDEVSQILDLPQSIVPTVLVSVGYPLDAPPDKVRHPVDDILI